MTVIEYDELLDVLDDGLLPVASVIACEDPEGRVLYWGVHFSQHPIEGNLAAEAKQRGLPPTALTGAVAAYAIRLGHDEYDDAGS